MNRRWLGFTIATALAWAAHAAPDSPSIAITKDRFGAFKPGTKVTQASLHAAFPTATIKAVDDRWQITDAATGLHGTAGSDFLQVDGGKISLYGIKLGDDGAKLAGVNELDDLSCMVDSDRPGWVTCKQLPWLSVNANNCSIGKPKDAFSADKLAGCKVAEIYWMTAAAR